MLNPHDRFAGINSGNASRFCWLCGFVQLGSCDGLFGMLTFFLCFLILQLPEKLISKYNWIKQWKLGLKFEGKSEDLVDKIKESLTLLRTKVWNA